MGIWQKEDSGLHVKKIPLILICPHFICECSVGLLKLAHTKDALLTLMLRNSYTFSSTDMDLCSGFSVLISYAVFQ
jgi:hypothetical protein